MSNLTDRIAIIVTADTKGAVREIDQLGRKSKQSLGDAEKGLDRFAHSATRVGAAFVGVSVVAGAALLSTVGDAQEAEAAQIRLKNSIEGSKSVTKGAVGAFNEQAAALQKVTVATDEQVTAIQAMLIQFGRTKQETLQLTPAILDLSRKMGIDGATAASAVGKALDGNVGALKRLKVPVDAAAFSTDRYAATLEALRRAAGGFAEREGETLSGKIARLKNQFGEFKESVGKGVVGVLEDILPAATGAAEGLGKVDAATGGAIGKFATIGTITTAAVGGILLVAGAVAKLKLAFQEGNALAGGFGTAVRGIAGAGAAVGGVFALISGLEALTHALGASQTAAEKAAAAAKKATGSLVGDFLAAAAEGNRSSDIIVANFERMARGGNDFAAGQADNARANRTYFGEFRSLAQENLGTAERLLAGLRRHSGAAKEAGVDVGKLAKILREESGAQRQSASDSERGAAALDKHKRAAEGDTQAIDARRIAMLATFSSEISAAQSAQSLADVLADDQSSALDKNAALLSAAGSAAQAAADQYESLTGKTATAEDKQKFFRDSLIALGTQYPELAGQVNEYLAKLDTIPASKDTTVTVQTNTSALDSAIAKIHEVTSHSWTIVTDWGGSSSPGRPPHVRAMGGPIPGSGPVPIIAHGGEYVLSADVVRRIKSGSASQGAGGATVTGQNKAGDTYIININALKADANSGRLVADMLRAHKNAGGKV